MYKVICISYVPLFTVLRLNKRSKHVHFFMLQNFDYAAVIR